MHRERNPRHADSAGALLARYDRAMSANARARAIRAGLGLAVLLVALPVAADPDPCGQFSWDVRHERALFAQPAVALASGLSAADAPALKPERLYRFSLHPQPQVHFAAPPGRQKFAEGAHGGMVKLTVGRAGVYRVSLDQPAWVDVLNGATPLASQDFQARSGCHAPHKIVEFALPEHAALLLQLSAAAQDSLAVTLTRTPPADVRH